MNIAFIVRSFPVLSETFIINQITGLIDRGYKVDVYAEEQGDIHNVHPDVLKYRLLDYTYYMPSISPNLLTRLRDGIKILTTNFWQDPKKIGQSLNILKYGSPALSLWLLYTAIPQFKKQYDIIHCQFGTSCFRGMAFQTMNAPNAKLLTIFRGDDISRFVKEKGDRIYNQLFETGDFFLANCEYFKSRVIQLGCDKSKIKVHRSGLDCNKFAFTPRYFPADERVKIVTTGRLVEKKGIEYSIRAFNKVAKTHPNLEYNIIGDGPLREHLQQLIQELGDSQKINLLGWKNEEEIIKILNQSHIFVAPSVTAADGNQDAPVNVLKEAMALGLPVISTYHGGIPELVEDSISGFLVSEKDADALAEKLNYLIEHPDLWEKMGRAGRHCVENYYNLDNLNNQLVQIYQQLLNTV
ncbi:glycosyltransferase [Gloeocapsopsis crepidinum LEGE 06123]|uniref:Glycosyltransferase n=1 Tax=Gloeocapsopsis crepidinum LEGE 06123 TaxID=588587 RepID=A0ABR9ULT0_9CHRO|nr:glycosyltransferase [Gloeocapsopsis crepidinum]MBE9189240.1 glycosyltransferase [Gloeocapsopsis crepidinum LEGE 06123]